MDDIERLYSEYLMNYSCDSNFGSYDLEEQIIRDHIEKIIERRTVTKEDISLIRSILEDIDNPVLVASIEDYLEEQEALWQD